MFELDAQDVGCGREGSTGERPRRRRGGGPGARPLSATTRADWELFARRHGGELRRCVTAAMRRVGWRADPVEVDELVQESYVRLLQGCLPDGALDWPAPRLWGYLHRMAHSVVVDELRSRRARKRGGAGPERDDPQAPPLPPAELCLRDPRPDPEQRLLARERAAELRRRVRELGGSQHGSRNVRILELASVEGCTAIEISARLAGSLTPSSVHTLLHRLRQELGGAPREIPPPVAGHAGWAGG
jgi:RNA polymerase sigma factor (sigma-70 family)